MPHLSKRKLHKDDLDRLNDQLISSLASAHKRYSISNFIEGLLTKTERVMIAKRLAIIMLLEKGVTPYAVSQMVKVSSSTVARISLGIEVGQYRDVIKIIKQNVPTTDLIEKILRAGLPPRGRGRWKWVFEKLEK